MKNTRFQITETAEKITVTAFGETREVAPADVSVKPDGSRSIWISTAVRFPTGNKVHRGYTTIWYTAAKGWYEGMTYCKNRNNLTPLGFWDAFTAEEKNAGYVSKAAHEQNAIVTPAPVVAEVVAPVVAEVEAPAEAEVKTYRIMVTVYLNDPKRFKEQFGGSDRRYTMAEVADMKARVQKRNPKHKVKIEMFRKGETPTTLE